MSRIVCIRTPMVLSTFSLSTSITPPLAIAYLSGMLRANHHAIQTIDALGEGVDRLTPIEGTVGLAQGLSIEDIVDRIDNDAEIIGVSAMFSCAWTYDKKLINQIRDRFPKALVVLGGEHITACAEYVLRDCPAVDLCAMGEGEETLLDIVNSYFSGKDMNDISGIAVRKNGIPQLNLPRARIRNIDNIPEPYWDDLPLETYLSNGFGHGVDRGRSMPLLATRGCPFQCTFCSSPSMWTTRWEARSPRLVLEEMRKYIHKYEAKNFDLYDLTAIIRKDWIIEFCNLIIESGLKFTWQLPSGTRSEAIDESVVDKLWESGCRNMNYAPENGSPTVLKRIKKKVDLGRLTASMKTAIRRGLNVKTNMIFSFPEDTVWELLQSFLFGIKCAWMGVHDSTFIPYVPYPGSELYQQLRNAKKIEPMSDNYFDSLIPFSDLQYAKTYNPHFKDWQLVWIRYGYFLLFYGTAFLRRPWRFIKIFINLFLGKQESRGEATLRHIYLRQRFVKRLAVAR